MLKAIKSTVVFPKHNIAIHWLDLSTSPIDLSVLSPDERQRYEGFINPQKQHQFGTSRFALRQILADYLLLSPHEICFAYGQLGKPHIRTKQNPDNLQFNMSHSGTWFVCAVTRGHAVGIDIEVMRPLIDFDTLAQQQLSGEILLQFQRSSLEEKRRIFFIYWTQREAIFKATGKYDPSNVMLSELHCPPDFMVGHIAIAP